MATGEAGRVVGPGKVCVGGGLMLAAGGVAGGRVCRRGDNAQPSALAC